MITLSLTPTTFEEGAATELTLSATNVGPRPCTAVRLRVELPESIAVVRGSVKLDLDRLDPGATEPVRLVVRAKRAGEATLSLRTFSYSDGSLARRRPGVPFWSVTVRPRPAGPIGRPSSHAPRADRGMVFVSYRRNDIDEVADRLYDGLSDELGGSRVFIDAVDIDPGDDFPDRLHEALERSAALVVVIGPDWNPDDGAGTPRLYGDRDWIRHEIRYALEHRLAIFPVLGRGAVMPDDGELPADIRDLTRKNAYTVHRDTSRRRDVADVVTTICQWTRGRSPGQSDAARRRAR